MKPTFRRVITVLLVLAMVAAYLPPIPRALAAGLGPLTLQDGYLKVMVSQQNAGFSVWTEEGDKLNKADDNKNLLYHNGEYDTSFTSFQVTERIGGVDVTKEYLFGGDYNYAGSGTTSDPITITQDSTGISATWAVDGITITQRLELSNLGSSEHGMVRISYSVSCPRDIKVRARVLLDTALGAKDYAYYEIVNSINEYRSIESETVLETKDYIPANFFGYDDPWAPSIVAYTVNSGEMPYKVAFGHWNNLASTLFDFTPDPTLTFTNEGNRAYETADSAYALYYDLGSVGSGNSAAFSTYYGVYSNQHVPGADSIAVNVAGPSALTLTANKKNYLIESGATGEATFPVLCSFRNVNKKGASDLDEVAIAVYSGSGIVPLDTFGGELDYTPSYQNPYFVKYQDFLVGEERTTTFQFKALVGSEASYRKVEFRVFAMPGSAGGQLLSENQIGYYSFYILCPGGDGQLPTVVFTGSSPDILYNSGSRRLALTGTNFNMLDDKSRYTLTLTGPAVYQIPSDQIYFPEYGVLEVYLTEDMLAGDYRVTFEWGEDRPEGIPKSLGSPCLRVTMSEDKAYKNDVYGLVAVVRIGDGNNAVYQLRSSAKEGGLKSQGDYDEELLVFRGEFTVEYDAEHRPVYKATSQKSEDNNGNVTINNPITLNNCIDFDNGTVSVYCQGSGASQKVCVDFDGDLWTSTTRSSIWSGVAALTDIKNGTAYGLTPYNSKGEAIHFNRKPITLIWPCGLGIAQTIAGMVFNLTYGKLGIMYDTDETNPMNIGSDVDVLGYVLSFSAKLDLSFLVPNKEKSEEDKCWDKMVEVFKTEDQKGEQLRSKWNGLDINKKQADDPPDDDEEAQKGQASVMVDNILYGCGRGYIGFRCEVNVAIPGYIEAMPYVKAEIKINTIGNWSVAVDGSCKFATIEIEVSIDIRSYNGYPIPNKLYFFITGFEPGVNVDGFGVLWITGGGGGFDDLYDTIFACSGIPPLKILLSVTFDIVKVLSARADLSLSLRGLGFTVSDVKIKYTPIIALKRAALEFRWYPDFYFMASVRVDLLDVVKGSGYIVVICNDEYKGFVEFFARAKVSIPKWVFLIGGFEFAQADLGVNNEKIWGALKALGISIGITYHWGGDFDFGFRAAEQPTFPELLGYTDVPVHYDEEGDRTLYMRVGTNFSVAALPEVVTSHEGAATLLGLDPSVRSDPYKKDHRVDLGTYQGKAGVFAIEYAASSLEEAQDLASRVTVGDGPNPTGAGYSAYPLRPFDGTNLEDARSHVTYDEESGKASMAVIMADAADFEKTWYVKTPVASDIILYSVAAIPEVTSVTGVQSGDDLVVSWDGVDLDKLDQVSFYLTQDSDEDGDPGYYLGSLTQSATPKVTDKTASLPLPLDLPTGQYYIRAMYTKADMVKGTVLSTGTITHENLLQPAPPNAVTIQNAGDLSFSVTVENTADPLTYDDYALVIYEFDTDTGEWIPSPFGVLVREKDEDILVGGVVSGVVPGSALGPDEDETSMQSSLKPGTSYKVGVYAQKTVSTAGGGAVVVASTEVLSNEVVLVAPTPPELSVERLTPYKTLVRMEISGVDGRGKPVYVPVEHETYATDSVLLEIHSDVPVTGAWDLDVDAAEGDFTDTSVIAIDLGSLVDGDHTLTLRGEDGDGDSVRLVHGFTVDTMPPRLLLSSPTNGGFFSTSGGLLVSGQTDPDALFSVVVDGTVIHEKKTVTDLGGSIDQDGVFSFVCSVDPSTSSHHVLIVAGDEMGNLAKAEVRVRNMGFASLESIDLYLDGEKFTGLNLPTDSDHTGQLSMIATSVNGSGTTRFSIMESDLVRWRTEAVLGTASVDTEGAFSVSAGSIGYVVGSLRVWDEGSMTAAATFGAEAFDFTPGELVTGVTLDRTSLNLRIEEAETLTATVAPVDAKDQSISWESSNTNVATVTESGLVTAVRPGYAIITVRTRDGGFEDTCVVAVQAEDREPDTDYTEETRLVGPEAGTVTFFGGLLSIEFQADTFAPGTWLVVRQMSRGATPEDSSLRSVASPTFEILVSSSSMRAPVRLHIMYSDRGLGGMDPRKIGIYMEDESNRGQYIYIGGVASADDHTISVLLAHFSRYVVLGRKATFTDMEVHWGKEAVEVLASRYLLAGVGDGLFQPDRSVTRAELCKMLVGALDHEKVEKPQEILSEAQVFDDVAPGAWYYSYIQKAYNAGLVVGDAGRFRPDDPVTREEMAVMLSRAMGEEIGGSGEKLLSFVDKGDISLWAMDAVRAVCEAGLMRGMGEGLFGPLLNATRAEAATVMLRLFGILGSLPVQ